MEFRSTVRPWVGLLLDLTGPGRNPSGERLRQLPVKPLPTHCSRSFPALSLHRRPRSHGSLPSWRAASGACPSGDRWASVAAGGGDANGLPWFCWGGGVVAVQSWPPKLLSHYSPFSKGFITNVRTGAVQEVSWARTDRGGVGPRMVHRKALLEALAEELPDDMIRFSSRLVFIETQQVEGSSISILQLDDGTVIKTKVLIGCDGVHSAVSRWLGLGKPVEVGRFAVRGLSMFPEGHGYNYEVRQFLDEGTRAGIVPFNEKELFWFVVSTENNSKGGDFSTPESIGREVTENSAKDFPPAFLDVVYHSDLSILTWAALKMRLPWDVIFGKLCKGTVTVAGDAMHPMTPDLGQGGCLALENAVVLGQKIGKSFIENGRLVPQEVANALQKYVNERRWRAASLITGAYLTGWVQQDGSSWWRKFFRDKIFYKFLFHRLFDATNYDCGKLPIYLGELTSQSKIE